jgi:hypothetical protein
MIVNKKKYLDLFQRIENRGEEDTDIDNKRRKILFVLKINVEDIAAFKFTLATLESIIQESI